MKNRQARAIRAALQLGLPRSLSKEDRKQYRLAKRLYNGVPRQERVGYIQGLARVKADIIRMQQEIAKEKELQARENAETAQTVSATDMEAAADSPIKIDLLGRSDTPATAP